MKKDDKGMLNEILPDPKQAERDLARGSPRDRTAAHLRRIVAATAAALLPLQGALADNSVPGDKSQGRQEEGHRRAEASRQAAAGAAQLRRGRPDARAVRKRQRQDQSTLRVKPTTPAGATVLLDGEDIGQKTPIKKFKLGVGLHSLTITSPDGKNTQNLSLDMKAGQTIKEVVDLRPPKAPKK